MVTPVWMGVAGLPVALRKAPLWQVAQPVLTLKLTWNLPLAQVENPPLWQLSQLAEAAAATDL